MIQRIQTVYLLVGALLLGFFLVLAPAWFEAVSLYAGWVIPVLYVLAGVTAAAALLAVFFYKQRARQATMIAAALWLDLALVMVLVGAQGYLSFQTDADLTAAGAAGFAVLLLPIFAYVAFRLAKRGVQKDMDLVQSMDRLR